MGTSSAHDEDEDRGFVVLLVALVAVLVVHPFLEVEGHPSMIAEGVLGVAPLAGSVALRSSKTRFRITLFLWLPFAALWAARHATGAQSLRAAELLAALAFFTFVIICLLRCLFAMGRVRGRGLAGAAGIYILVGFAWTHLYELIEVVLPASFGDTSPTWNTFLYFSFMTLTTVGYGDLAPTSGPARAAAVLEAIVGVLYVGFVVARFASLYARAERKEP